MTFVDHGYRRREGGRRGKRGICGGCGCKRELQPLAPLESGPRYVSGVNPLVQLSSTYPGSGWIHVHPCAANLCIGLSLGLWNSAIWDLPIQIEHGNLKPVLMGAGVTNFISLAHRRLSVRSSCRPQVAVFGLCFCLCTVFTQGP
jgi:hypothetical protein